MFARKRGLITVWAGDPGVGLALGADGIHGRSKHVSGLLRTAPAHNIPEVKAAERAGVDLIFVSPVFATRSHPGAGVLGPVRFAQIVRAARIPVIALGGMTPARMRRLQASGAYGWGAIDYWSG